MSHTPRRIKYLLLPQKLYAIALQSVCVFRKPCAAAFKAHHEKVFSTLYLKASLKASETNESFTFQKLYAAPFKAHAHEIKH